MRPQNRVPLPGKGAHDGVGDVMDAFSAPREFENQEAPAVNGGAFNIGWACYPANAGPPERSWPRCLSGTVHSCWRTRILWSALQCSS